jgi:hypothetical protein
MTHMKKLSARVAVLFGSWLFVGCGGEPSIDLTAAEASAGDARGNVCFRGERRFAELVDGRYIIEGDIIVSPEDQWCAGEESLHSAGNESVGTQTHATRVQGMYKWPNGRIVFKVSPALSATLLAAVYQAMDNWEAAVPGIVFVPYVASATAYVDIKPGVEGRPCQSALGWQNAPRELLLPSTCGVNAIEHELGHAMGLYHEQSRKDRDSFVIIHWSKISGCPNSANGVEDCTFAACSASAAMAAECGCPSTLVTDPEAEAKVWPLCDMAGQFQRFTKQSDINDYNLMSLMHYGSTAFRKSGLTGNTIDSIPAGQSMRGNVISDQDARNVQAMYPVIRTRQSVFATAGVDTRVCDLEGRSEDAATKYRFVTATERDLLGYLFAGHSIRPSIDVGVKTLTNRFCGAQSYFWGHAYDYPNSDPANFEVVWDTEELFEEEGDVTLITSALLPILL